MHSRPNYNSAKVRFAYFGSYLGVVPDKEKASFVLSGLSEPSKAKRCRHQLYLLSAMTG
jgi:hypothetical protein